MWNAAACHFDLANHRFFVSVEDGEQIARRAEGVHHRDRRRETHLEARILRQFPAAARLDEIEIGRARFARVAEFTEMHVRRVDTLGETQLRKPEFLTNGPAGIGAKNGFARNKRILPRGPQPPATGLAVRNTAEPFPSISPTGRKTSSTVSTLCFRRDGHCREPQRSLP